MSSLPIVLILSGIAFTVYKLANRVTPEDFLIQDPSSVKITDPVYIEDMKAGKMGWNGTRYGGAQFF